MLSITMHFKNCYNFLRPETGNTEYNCLYYILDIVYYLEVLIKQGLDTSVTNIIVWLYFDDNRYAVIRFVL